MVFENYIWEVLERNKIRVVTNSMDWGLAIQVLNESAQVHYPHMLRADKSFYQKSEPFSAPGAGNTVNLPSDCYKVELVEVAVARGGAARKIDLIEFQDVNLNDYATGATNTPIYRVDKSTFDIFPASSGTIHYLRTIPYVTDIAKEMTDPGVGAEPPIHWLFEESWVTYACKLLKQQHYRLSENPSTVSQQLQGFEEAMEAVKNTADPMQIYASELPQKA